MRGPCHPDRWRAEHEHEFDRLAVQVFFFLLSFLRDHWFHELEANRLNGQPFEGRKTNCTGRQSTGNTLTDANGLTNDGQRPIDDVCYRRLSEKKLQAPT